MTKTEFTAAIANIKPREKIIVAVRGPFNQSTNVEGRFTPVAGLPYILQVFEAETRQIVRVPYSRVVSVEVVK